MTTATSSIPIRPTDRGTEGRRDGRPAGRDARRRAAGGESGEREDNGDIILHDAAYSGCAIEDIEGCAKKPSWEITAVRVHYDDKQKRVRYKGAQCCTCSACRCCRCPALPTHRTSAPSAGC
jgi:hypothetical protein